MGRGFIDTNVLVYAFTADPRAAAAQALLAQGCVVSIQGLNEFVTVARRKLAMSWREVEEALAAIRRLCPPVAPMDVETHLDGLRIAERHGFAFFDALMLASARRAGCAQFWSEDMQHGMVIDGAMTISNPFRAS
jgi:predicted nucleic acid-binding protein